MNREQIMMQVVLKKEFQLLVSYFNGDGYSQFGFRGDGDGLSPVQTAIRAMREFDTFLGSPIGAEAHLKFQHAVLVEKGLVPA